MALESARYDFGVVGAGIVGLAVAREVLDRHPHSSVAVFEKEAVVGLHQSGHNSGVIHTGIYYQPGSLRADLCRDGAARMKAYCSAHRIPCLELGKIIVATRSDEVDQLRPLLARGRANRIQGLELLTSQDIRRLEPHLNGLEAIWSPRTAVTDFRLVTSALSDDVRLAGGRVVTRFAVRAITRGSDGVEIRAADGRRARVRRLVTCAGLQADRVAVMSGGSRHPAVIPFRGAYWLLRPELRGTVRHLVYPVPDPTLPFLGVHFTPQVSGDVSIGPNAVLALAREGYRRRNVNFRDVASSLSYPGMRALAATHWRSGLREFGRDMFRRLLLKDLQRYLPGLTVADLVPGPSGVRAQAVDRDGGLVDDFVIDAHRDGRVLDVRNAPSPAATASLAIAATIADALEAS